MSDSERRYLDAIRLARVHMSAWRERLDDLSRRIDAQWVLLAQIERDYQLSLRFEETDGELL